MAVLMKSEGLVWTPPGLSDLSPGLYLRSYDPEANGGRGAVSWTANAAEAVRFADPAAALTMWQAVPACHPTRPDGKPNRPLTAYTVTFDTVP